jgi:hypothetical protein
LSIGCMWARESVKRFSTSGFFIIQSHLQYRSLIKGLTPFRIWLKIYRNICCDSRQNRKWCIDNPQLFYALSTCTQYSMGLFTREIFLLHFPFKRRYGLVKPVWNYNSWNCVSGVIDTAELSNISENMKPYAKRFLTC